MQDAKTYSSIVGVRLRLAVPSDLPYLAHIHKCAYSRLHFTALLPEKTLAAYYGHFLDGTSEICLATSGTEILGFAVYGTDINKRILAFKKMAAADIFFTSLLNPLTAIKKLINFLSSVFFKNNKHTPTAFLLLSIAVHRPGRGVGRCLLQHLSEEARRRGEKVVGLYVNAYNISAINTYFAESFRVIWYERGQFYMEKYFEK